jgi:hypothetical protein
MDCRGCGTAYLHAEGRAISFGQLSAQRCRSFRIPRNSHRRRGRSHPYRRRSSGSLNGLNLTDLRHG